MYISDLVAEKLEVAAGYENIEPVLIPRDNAGDVLRAATHGWGADVVFECAGAAASIWVHAQQRRPGRPKVRLFNPERDSHGWASPHTVVEIINDDMPFLVDTVAGLITDFLPAEDRLVSTQR